MNHAERQSRYVKLQARNRGVALERIKKDRRLAEDYETKINVGGDPHLFDKVTVYLAKQHGVTPEYIVKVRKAVRRS